MEIAVAGLWHLGTVTAACMASVGHQVVGHDPNGQTIELLQQGGIPVDEPGLGSLLAEQVAAGRLQFTSDPAALATAEVLWVAYDTPVDDHDRADVEFVMRRIDESLDYLPVGALVLISSQLPVGSLAKLEEQSRQRRPHKRLSFAFSPENLRLGKGIERFLHPDRIVVGVRDHASKGTIGSLLAPVTDRIEWMSVESAEMTKHAINAFLATSVVFANELATICERVGADAAEVERGLKTDARIGAGAYVGAGGAFAGGTLARDVAFLIDQGAELGLPLQLFPAVRKSNDTHRQWRQGRLVDALGKVAFRNVAILGLTYKPGTDTLRRSSSVETCQWLAEQGAVVRAFDPAVQTLPSELANTIHLCSCLEDALTNADAVVLATPWPQFSSITADQLLRCTARPLVLDESGFLRRALANDGRIEYFRVGKAA